MAEPWDRQEGESELLFSRFERYRAMGPGRTLEATYRAQTGRKGVAPGYWRESATRWRWRERAEAWDAVQTARARALEEETLEAARRRWAETARLAQAKALERLTSMLPGELSPRDLLSYLTDGVKLELLARGEATDKREYSVPELDALIAAELGRLAPGRQGGPARPPAAGADPG